MARRTDRLTLNEAAIEMRMPEDVVLKCVRYTPRKLGKLKLACEDQDGEPVFNRASVIEFLKDLAKPWATDAAYARPRIPTYFQDALRLESRLRCGLCGTSFAAEYAHIEPWEKCLHHHPWNLIALCTRCHKAFDRERRISQEEVQRAKDILQSAFVEQLQYRFTEEQFLDRVKTVSFTIEGKVMDGVDLFVSMIHPDNRHLELRRCRVFQLLEHVDSTSNESEPAGLVRLIETLSAHMEHANLCTPLWHEVANSIYQYRMYPHSFRRLNRLGQRVVDRLLRRPDAYLNLDKYSSLGGRDDHAIAQKLIESCQAISEHYDKKESLEDDGFDVWGL